MFPGRRLCMQMLARGFLDWIRLDWIGQISPLPSSSSLTHSFPPPPLPPSPPSPSPPPSPPFLPPRPNPGNTSHTCSIIISPYPLPCSNSAFSLSSRRRCHPGFSLPIHTVRSRPDTPSPFPPFSSPPFPSPSPFSTPVSCLLFFSLALLRAPAEARPKANSSAETTHALKRPSVYRSSFRGGRRRMMGQVTRRVV